MDVFTIQLSNWRTAVDRGIRVVNATMKANHPYFAPLNHMVWGVKDGRISECDYTRMYRDLMTRSVQENQIGWDEFLLQYHDQQVAIGCFCGPGEFCHRHLLIPMLAKYAAWRGIPFTYYGELLPDVKNKY